MEKLLENRIWMDHYAGNDSVGTIAKLRTLFRLIGLVLKVWIKSQVPYFDDRNDRWHYRQTVDADRGRA